MQKNAIIVFILALATIGTGYAQKKRFYQRPGVGVILGSPTGLSGRYQHAPRSSIDAALAWSLDSDSSIHLHADYLFHRPTGKRLDGHSLYWYYGAGARLTDNGDTGFGPRAPIGLNLFLKNSPLEVFAEIAAIFEVVESTDLDVDAGIGIRYFF